MKETQKVWTHGNDALKSPYRYRSCGLDDVWLASGYEVTDCDGETVVSVKNLDDLHKAIGFTVIKWALQNAGRAVRRAT